MQEPLVFDLFGVTMHREYFDFETVSVFVERISGYKVSRSGVINGVRLGDTLSSHFGKGARRHYPFGMLVVLPTDPSPFPFLEQIEERDSEAEPGLVFCG